MVAERRRAAHTANAGGLPALAQVLEAALTRDIDSFEPFALRSLGSVVGFDGAVWGSGVVSPADGGTFAITRASLVDRPTSLLDEYPEVAPHDPVTARFLRRPDEPIAASAGDYLRSRADLGSVGEYLGRHRIAHLMLMGSPREAVDAPARERHWITAYRESGDAFAASDLVRLGTWLPFWIQARDLCLARHMERLARTYAVERSAIALCDPTGLIHAAEPAFSDMTALRRGDAIGLPGDGAALESNGQRVGLRSRAIGSWVLVQAARESRGPTLSRRERQVAQEYARGLSHKQIARAWGSAPSTVRTQLQNIYRRLGVHTRTELQRALAGSATSESA